MPILVYINPKGYTHLRSSSSERIGSVSIAKLSYWAM